MDYNADIEILLTEIRDTIRGQIDGSISIEQVKDEYRDLLTRYRKLERACQSPESRGFIRGLLYQNNRRSGAKLTALLMVRAEIIEPLAFSGDKILLNALPDIISMARPEIENGETRRTALAGAETAASTDSIRLDLVLKKIPIGPDSLFLAAVTSDPRPDLKDFEFLSELIRLIFTKNNERYLPATLNYVRDISADISRAVRAGEGAIFFIDHYQLLNPGESFSYIGVYPMIQFSDYIVDTLKKSYPEEIIIYALSVTAYLVLYDEKTRDRITTRRDRLDFSLHGNSIPYKVAHREINGPQALYFFLEGL